MSELTYKQRLIATASMYNKSLSAFEIGAWQEALKSYEDEQIARALESHVKDPDRGQFMPKIADIVRLIDGDSKDRSHIAWQKAFNAISDVGQYQDVCFDDGAIHAAIEEMGGWVKFCMMEVDDISYNQHRFCELYKTHLRIQGAYPKLLVGVAGANNRLHSHKVTPPVPIGNVDKCRLVYKNGGGYRFQNGGMLIDAVTKKITSEAQS